MPTQHTHTHTNPHRKRFNGKLNQIRNEMTRMQCFGLTHCHVSGTISEWIQNIVAVSARIIIIILNWNICMAHKIWRPLNRWSDNFMQMDYWYAATPQRKRIREMHIRDDECVTVYTVFCVYARRDIETRFRKLTIKWESNRTRAQRRQRRWWQRRRRYILIENFCRNERDDIPHLLHFALEVCNLTFFFVEIEWHFQHQFHTKNEYMKPYCLYRIEYQSGSGFVCSANSVHTI